MQSGFGAFLEWHDSSGQVTTIAEVALCEIFLYEKYRDSYRYGVYVAKKPMV